MGETTGIAWARSTWNPWIGCTEVSTAENGGGGCDNCYARELDKRHRYGGATHWGVGVPRYRTKQWGQPVRWNVQAALTGERWTVFPSLCDPFDNEVPAEWHGDLWRLIRATPHLTWLLLTKRIGHVRKMHPGGEHPNVWIGASVVNQKEADRDIPRLLEVDGFAKRFVSYEPALGPVDFSRYLVGREENGVAPGRPVGTCVGWTPPLDQIIVGGESAQGGAKARPFEIDWAREVLRQCRASEVAFFMKQMGSNVVVEDATCSLERAIREGGYRIKHRAGADPSEWPEDLRVQEVPA